LAITVAQTYEDDKLPFENEFFDCVVNRHESFDSTEVDRVLKPGGYFVTQQVGNQNEREFAQRLIDGLPPFFPAHTIENYVNTLRGMGYQILRADEFRYPMKFYDVGALVYYAKVIPWEFPGFSVKTHLDKLFACQKEIEEKGFLPGSGHRWIIVAQKP
jgi:SAM-dependent methyltransferase